MTADLALLVAFGVLLFGICLFWLAHQFTLRDTWQDMAADLLTYIRTWTWRKNVLQLGLYFIAIGQRLMEYGQRPETPSETKVTVSLAREWEKPVEMWRDEDQIMVMAGGRVVPFKR